MGFASVVAQTLVPNVEEVMNRGAEVKTSYIYL